MDIYHIMFFHSCVNRHLGCSQIWLLWIMLLWTLVHKYWFESLLLVLLSIHLGAELQDPMVIIHFTFWGTTIMFFPVAVPFHIPQQQFTRVPISPHPHQHFFSIFFFGNSYINGAFLHFCATSEGQYISLGHGKSLARVWTLTTSGVGWRPNSVSYWLCGFVQIHSLYASFSLLLNRENNSSYFTELLWGLNNHMCKAAQHRIWDIVSVHSSVI